MRYILVLVFCVVGIQCEDSFVKVRTEYGGLRGRVQQSIITNKTYYSFRGIPYAAPPLDELRFEPPQAFFAWEGVRDVLEYGNECPQIDTLFETEIHGNEDCLFINVFTPELPNKKSTNKAKPVMVFIHGGGYVSGSGDNALNGPDFFIQEDVVLVTFNYRLGVLGFLSLEDTEAPGNYGLKDQIEALRWVQRNIQTFGGDATNVTIFGHSAGGGSTSLLMVSQQSENLFHRVISQSGTLVNAWALIKHKTKDHAFKLGKLLGYETTDSQDLLRYLRKAPAYKMVEFGSQTAADLTDYSRPVEVPFGPTIEPKEMGVHAMFHTDPMVLLQSGEFNKVPLMLGHTSQESIIIIPNSQLNYEITKEFLKHPKIDMPLRDLIVPYESETYNHIAREIRVIYSLADESLDSNERFATILSDTIFRVAIELAAQIQTNISGAPTYFYKFSYDGKFNRFKKLTNPSLSGASHADELCYLFSCKSLEAEYKQLDEDSTELKMIRAIVKLWTNFAKTGNPTPKTDEILDNITWLPRTSDDFNYLDIDEQLKPGIIEAYDIQKWRDLLQYIEDRQSHTANSNRVEL